MTIKLWTVGGGIHAVFYKNGVMIAEQDMGDTVEVRPPTPEEERDKPATLPGYAIAPDSDIRLGFTGFFIVPGSGPRSGLAAIFGAIKPGE